MFYPFCFIPLPDGKGIKKSPTTKLVRRCPVPTGKGFFYIIMNFHQMSTEFRVVCQKKALPSFVLYTFFLQNPSVVCQKKRYPVLFHALFLQNPSGFCHSRAGGNRVYFIETWKLTREFRVKKIINYQSF
jgi:hypothetical protein